MWWLPSTPWARISRGRLGATWDGHIIHDPLQEARVTFMRCGGPETPAVELVEPAGDNSPLQNSSLGVEACITSAMKSISLDIQLEQSRGAGCLVVKNPLPAVAFGGRRIAWVYTRQKLLVEYLER